MQMLLRLRKGLVLRFFELLRYVIFPQRTLFFFLKELLRYAYLETFYVAIQISICFLVFRAPYRDCSTHQCNVRHI